MNTHARALAIVVDPAAEWAAIAGEPGDPAYLLSRYVALLAVIPAVSSFAGASFVGEVTPNLGLVRASIFNSLFGAIYGYVLSCATVLVLGIVLNVVAPLFGGRRDFDNAFKLAVYSYTPVWLTGIFLVLPGLRFLTLMGFYGTYLLWLGLPRLGRITARHALVLTGLIVLCAFALTYGAAVAQRLVFGTPGL